MKSNKSVRTSTFFEWRLTLAVSLFFLGMTLAVNGGSTAWTRGRGAHAHPSPGSDGASVSNPVLVSAASRMTHGSAGTFDLSLPSSGTPGVEPRSDGTMNYTIVLTFNKPVMAGTATAPPATVSHVAFDGNNMIISLAGVTDKQTLTVTANNVTGTDNTVLPSASVQVSFLAGDVNQDGAVNAGDTAMVRSNAGETLDNTNFLNDVNADGMINVGDTIVVRTLAGNSIH